MPPQNGQTEKVIQPNERQKQSPVSIDLSDLVAVVNVIDACSRRGAFEGGELQTVGALRNKIAFFVESNTKKPEVTDETNPEKL